MTTLERSAAPENPESLRAQILDTLPKYQISPVNPTVPKPFYGDGYFEFIHECHDLGDRLMRVNGEEVYIEGEGTIPNEEVVGPGTVRIDEIDQWEAASGYTAAMLYDPRWLLTRLTDLETSNKGSYKELKGNLAPRGLMSKESITQSVQQQSKEELIQGLEDASTRAGVSDEEHEELQEFVGVCLPLSEEEVRQMIIQERTKPWQFAIEVDQRNLPISITPNVKMLQDMLWETEGRVKFQYDNFLQQ